eukprot:jgi/Ulvmu1/499/UM001_0507.1
MGMQAWLIAFSVLALAATNTVAYVFDVAPPRCAWAVFVHTSKTGGTHLRFMFEGQQCCEANKALWNSTGWGWNMQTHMMMSEHDPQFLVDWLHGNGGRVFSEAHITQNLAESLTILRDIERTEIWQRSGCLLWIFTMIRNPVMFLRSNLHDTFLHSVYRQRFVEQFGNDIRYLHDGDHHAVSTYAEELVDLQVREVAHMLTVDECVAEDVDAPGTIDAQFSCVLNVLDHMDFLGITEHMPLTLVALQVVLGLQDFPNNAAACNSHSHSWSQNTLDSRAADEHSVLQDISMNSNYDWAMYSHARERFIRFLQDNVPDAHVRLAAFLETYGDTACTNGTFDAEHRHIFKQEED